MKRFYPFKQLILRYSARFIHVTYDRILDKKTGKWTDVDDTEQRIEYVGAMVPYREGSIYRDDGKYKSNKMLLYVAQTDDTAFNINDTIEYPFKQEIRRYKVEARKMVTEYSEFWRYHLDYIDAVIREVI